MRKKRIVVLRSSPYVVERQESPEMEGETVVSFEEVKAWIKSGKIIRYLFRFEEAVMVVYDLKLIVKPFGTALILWSLARKKKTMRDGMGVLWEVDLGLLWKLLRNLLGDFWNKGKFFKGLEFQVKTLGASLGPSAVRELDLTRTPVYLRTDLCFGLRSGGSVGHIAGVLNHLDQFSGKPLFLSTDSIPTVRTDLEYHQILPGEGFWDFSEMPAFRFNDKFFDEALRLLGDKKLSFIYQRYSLNNLSGLKLARRYQVPFVLEYNGSEIWVGRNWGSPLKYEALSLKIEDLNLSGCDLAVVVSQPLKKELMDRGVEGDKVLVNPNGVDVEVYSPRVQSGKTRSALGLEGKQVVGFIGTFGRWHGAEILAEAFGRWMVRFPEYKEKTRLLMIGDGATAPLVREILRKHGVLDLCVLTGTIPQAEGPAHLAVCDLLVAPHVPNPDGTPFFGSPTKLFEYMAMGKGIVASDLDQIGEILKHDVTAWMVKPGDPESLMMGLKTLLEDGARRDRLGKAAREEAVAKYTWKEHTRKIIWRLKEICGE